ARAAGASCAAAVPDRDVRVVAMMLFVTAALFVVCATALVRRMRIDGLLERALYVAVVALALWLGSTWILALAHILTKTALIVRIVVLLVIAVVALRRVRRMPVEPSLHWIAFLPVAIWIAYVLWRGAVLPPVSHDALSYHLPKATLFSQQNGFVYFPFLNPAIRTLPVNYEMLLTEMILWSGTDELTEWISVLMYLLFVVTTGALVERWWGRTAGSLIAMMCAAGIPVVVLHSGAHKNDMMVATLMAAALVAIGKWITDGGPSLYVAVIAVALAVGTKPQAAILGVVLAPMILWRLRRDAGAIMKLVAVSIVAFFLLGGAVYVANFLHEGSILNAKDVDRENVEIVPYGDWSTLWQGPYVLLAAPFSLDRYALKVPWEAQPWFWRRYEIYFSELGIVFSIAALLSPFAFAWSRTGSSLERRVVTIAALMTFAVMLPVGFKPHGLYTISLPRYALFIVPVVFGWTIGALNGRRGDIALAIAVVLFCATAIVYAKNDAFAPFAYFQWARQNPDTRVVLFDPNRAASVADRAAGPREKIAIDAGFGTWIQPAFGADLHRPVEFIPPGDGPPQIDDDAQYVAVDRAYAVVWGHPDFRDLSQARKYLLRGTPSRRDVRVIEALLRDSRWEVVLYNPRMVQAVFHRRHARL
ncbi:MAG TPA: hypothetical protein VF980_17175, partial [Thermoanaerobaculia bacterium]